MQNLLILQNSEEKDDSFFNELSRLNANGELTEEMFSVMLQEYLEKKAKEKRKEKKREREQRRKVITIIH